MARKFGDDFVYNVATLNSDPVIQAAIYVYGGDPPYNAPHMLIGASMPVMSITRDAAAKWLRDARRQTSLKITRRRPSWYGI